LKIATVQERLGDPTAAAETWRSCLAIVQRWADLDPSKRSLVTSVRERIAYFLAFSGEPAGAEPAMREALDAYLEAFGPNPNANARRSIAKSYKLLAEIQKRTA